MIARASLDRSCALVALLNAGLVSATAMTACGASAAEQPQSPAPAASTAQPATPARAAWSRGSLVKEVDGKLIGGWTTSMVQVCSAPPPLTSVEAASIVRLNVTFKCADGEEIYGYFRREGPPPAPTGPCAFAYVTIGGLVPRIFQDLPSTPDKPAAFAALRQALPSLRRALGVKLDGVYLALIGWTDTSIYDSATEAEKNLVAAAELTTRTGTGSSSYKIERDTPTAIVVTTDYAEAGGKRRDVGLHVIAGKACVFSIKFSTRLMPGDAVNDGNWKSIEDELDRIRRVIRDHEAGLPTLVSGVK
jgi:hypothetical protein